MGILDRAVIYHGFEPQTIKVAIGMPCALTMKDQDDGRVDQSRVLVTGYLTFILEASFYTRTRIIPSFMVTFA